MKTITINGTDYKVKYTIRALFLFEQITGKPFAVNTLLDNYIFFYCMILVNNTDKDILDWDDFINAIDNDADLMKQLTDIQLEQQKKNELLADDSEEGDNDSSSKKN